MNTRQQWEKLRALFAESLQQPDAGLDEWIGQACAGDRELADALRRLLAQRSNPAAIFAGDAQAVLDKIVPRQVDIDVRLGTDIGPYRLQRLLGEGGMGRVYLAERRSGDFTQTVALKLIRSEFASDELHWRFLRERNTLARLAHPNIAHLHDGGAAADGTPYFTLEFIDGTPLTRWCDEHARDARARVGLMLKVCDAVLHAHRNLVVHRDLKPSNVLVNAAGEPKLLDFGIAKPLAEVASQTLTHAESRPMTREYAAPEQLLGDPVTTATDIYALGVLLYRLLCGHLPYRRAELGETSWIKAILEDPPEPMEHAVERSTPAAIAAERSTTVVLLKRALRGDLERIVQRALAKDPAARYPTVDKFVDDLRAWLEGRAISGGTRTYRLRKFVRRYWLPMSAGALVILTILASAIGLAWEAGQVERQARTTAAVKDFLTDLFQRANPEIANGNVPTMRDAVDLGVKRLDSIPTSEPELRAELQVTLGVIYFQLGLQQQARDMHHAAFAVLKEHSSDALLAVRAERFEAVETGGLGDYAAAQALADDTYVRLQRVGNPPVAELVRTLDTINNIAVHRSDLARQKQVAEQAVVAIENASVDDEVRAMAWAMKADYLRRSHNDLAAVDYYKRLWPLHITAQTRSGYGLGFGESLQALGRYEEAARYLGETWDLTRQAYGDANTRTLRIGQLLAINEAFAGQVGKASEHFAALLKTSQQHVPPREDVIAEIQLNLGELLGALQRHDQAEAHVGAALDYCKAHPNADTRLFIEAWSALGTIQMHGGKLREAQQALEASLAAAAAHHVHEVNAARAALALVQAQRGDMAGALLLAEQARDGVRMYEGEKSFDAADVHYLYGRVLALAQRDDDAQHEYRAAIATHSLLLPPDGLHFYSADARFALGMLLIQSPAQREEGRKLLAQAASLRADTLGAQHPSTLAAQRQLSNLETQP